jgi:glycosyltransferase involved in cell wall biosynthesis
VGSGSINEVDQVRIVICHNYYRERGGEDQVFEDEVDLLTSHGHQVTTFVRNNNDIDGLGRTVRVALGTPWNHNAAAELAKLVHKTRAEIVHFHNWVPQISPAAFYAARKAGAAVVQTLHNYRWACPKGIFFRDNELCEECLGKTLPWPAVRHACYRDSRVGSLFLGSAIGLHNVLRTTERAIDAFIAPGPFIKEKMTEAGIPGERIYIKPNFLTHDPGPGSGKGGYVMYLGRLSPEKKIDTLLAAWDHLDGSVPLKISGIGPLQPEVEAAANSNPSIEYLGFASNEALDGLLGDASALVFPSGTYEAQPMTILETYAKGTPVIAARLGSMATLIEDGATGWHFEPGNARDLADVVSAAFRASDQIGPMRKHVREKFLKNYTPTPNHEMAMQVYETAIRRRATNP